MLKALSRFFPKFALTGFVAAGLLLSPVPAHATVTLEIYFEDGSLADGAVAILVADVNADGFLSPSDPSVSGTVLSEGEFVGGSDDVIVAVLQADDGPHWDGSAGIVATLERVPFADMGIAEGTPLILYLFPDITQPGEVVILGDEVVSYRNDNAGGSGGDIGFETPPDSGYYTISALTTAQGGNYDPQNPAPGETYETVNTGVPGSDGSGGNRANATSLTSGQPTSGSLTPGDLDFYRIPVNGLSRIIARTSGGTDTVGSLFGPGGSLLNDPVADDGNPDFLIDLIVDEVGILDLAVRGKDDNQTGAYDLVVEVIPLGANRPDLTIGKSPSDQRGDGTYNGSGAGQKFVQVSKSGRKVKFIFKVQNDAGMADIISVRGTPKDKKFKVVYLKVSNGIANVTAAMKQAGFPATLEPLQEETFMLSVKPSRRAGRAKKKFLIDATSVSSLSDRVQALVKAK